MSDSFFCFLFTSDFQEPQILQQLVTLGVVCIVIKLWLRKDRQKEYPLRLWKVIKIMPLNMYYTKYIDTISKLQVQIGKRDLHVHRTR